MILFVNSCVRSESRTEKIARALLSEMGSCVKEVRLADENLLPLTEERLNHRLSLLNSGKKNDPMFDYAREFASADTVVIAAPYWDLSFPSLLKLYAENIAVTGITFRYNENGEPEGLCKAKNLYYVSTSGGPFETNFGYEYWKALAMQLLGITKTKLVSAEMLDIVGNDADKIVSNVTEHIKEYL